MNDNRYLSIIFGAENCFNERFINIFWLTEGNQVWFETRKFDWTLDTIRIEKISRFLELEWDSFWIRFKAIQLFYA